MQDVNSVGETVHYLLIELIVLFLAHTRERFVPKTLLVAVDLKLHSHKCLALGISK